MRKSTGLVGQWLSRAGLPGWRGAKTRAGRLVRRAANRLKAAAESDLRQEHVVALPDGFAAKRAIVRLSVPKMPAGDHYSFTEHRSDADGRASDTVTACTIGGFALSEDLGASWRHIAVRKFSDLNFRHTRMLTDSEILLIASDQDEDAITSERRSHLVVCDLDGKVLHSTHLPSATWHGPRAIDLSGDTLMFAEYTPNGNRAAENAMPHLPSRVWRSCDFGRTWAVVREEPNVRHFHFLQRNPMRPREWWLTSGDTADESRIWKSDDDGDSWIDQTERFGPTVRIGDETFSRRMFRLTDLAWIGDDIVWGCDDVLRHQIPEPGRAKPAIGSRVFRANLSSDASPRILGRCGPEVRNIVDVGDFSMLMTQNSQHFGAASRPGVYLMPNGADGAAFCHLFDTERHATGRTGFTYSRASRAAKDGVFFTFRGTADVFKAPNRILKWHVTFD